MRAEIESNVGLCGLKISALHNPEAIDKLIQKFLGYVLWHDCASAVFGGGKKAKFGRDSAYSDELGVHAKTAIEKILQPFFDDISIETYAFIKQTEEQKFMKFCKSLGMSEEQAKAGWTTAQAAQEKPTEEKPEVVLE